MFRVRREQIDAFQPVVEAEFALRIVDYLRQHHPRLIVKQVDALSLVERIPEESLLQLVRSGITRARANRFTFSSSISAFVVLMFKAAPNFDQNPTISQSLKELLTEEQRLPKLLETAGAEIWQQAKDHYDPSAWKQAKKGSQR